MRANGIIVAIDGPAGAGKSTTAKSAAARLRYLYMDTGAMYRAVAHAVLAAGLDPDDGDAVGTLAESLSIEQTPSRDGTRTRVDGKDVGELIRTQDVSNAASRVAVHPRVREVLVRLQKSIGADGGIVLEGRDTTTAIFPDAELKVFLEATVEERARRRFLELERRQSAVPMEQLVAEIEERDARDRQTQSQHGPWPTTDAIRVDTTGMTIEAQVDRIVALAIERGAEGTG